MSVPQVFSYGFGEAKYIVIHPTSGDSSMNDIPSHSFAIMAYKGAPFLEETVQSVLKQTVSSQVYLSTSTPNDRIRKIAEDNHLPLFVNTGKAGITGDWEFALSSASTPYVTLVDQDDIYLENYAETVVNFFRKYPDTLIVFADYREIDHTGTLRKLNKTMRIKHLLLWPFVFRKSLKGRGAKRSVLRIGNPVCSPSVTYNIPALGGPHLFDPEYTMALDWDAWIRMADMKGRFCYSRKPLLYHRLHEATQTSGGISGGRRYAEDLQIYERLWPKRIAKALADFYAESYKTNL